MRVQIDDGYSVAAPRNHQTTLTEKVLYVVGYGTAWTKRVLPSPTLFWPILFK